jgi:Zn-dependent protease
MLYKQIKIGKIVTSKIELVDITKAWLALSLAFAFVISGVSAFEPKGLFTANFLQIILISSFTAGIGFLFHELAHKFVAQKYGCTAEFRSFDQMLLLALGLAFLVGFIFAAPGAVMISGMITRRENGIISFAGPLTNYILGMIFLGLTLIKPEWAFFTSIGFTVNMFLGLFNMIPFGNFDGIKIFRWNPYIWGAMVAFGIIFVFVL